MKRRFYLIFMFCAVLSACGGVAEPTPERIPITFRAPMTPTFIGECAQIDPLEAWLQSINLRYGEFDTFLMLIPEMNSTVLYDETRRLGEVVAVVTGLNVPDCAVDAQALMVVSMQETAAAFQAYVNEGAGDLDDLVVAARTRFEPANAAYDALLNELNRLYEDALQPEVTAAVEE